MTREQTIEDEIRAERDPSNPEFLNRVIRDVAHRPGYHCTDRWRPFETKEKREFRRAVNRVIDQAVKDGKLNRGFNGKLFPGSVKPLTIWHLASHRHIWVYYGEAVAIWLAGLMVVSIVGAAVYVTAKHMGVTPEMAATIRDWLTIPVCTLWTANRLGDR